MAKATESFTSRFGLVATTIGMAIGAGNIWRFPRLAGQYGGSFLIPWLLFLFLWSIPLLIVEFSIGKKTKYGTIGAFKQALGERFAWMGWFVGVCTTAILFYYSVVTGWSLKYFAMAVSGQLATIDHSAYWTEYTASIYQPLFYHFVAIAIGALIIYRGIVHGIERFSKIIVPLLFILLVVAAVKALTLNGAEKGLAYFFNFDLQELGHYKIWLEGLSQSAWSTGAGWGLLLTYAIYARADEKIVGNSFLAGLGNNLASIIAGLAIIPTVFALSASTEAAMEGLASGNQGLAFIVIPQLFNHMPAGALFASVFFLALFFAALSSLISMIELAVRLLLDFGLSRKKAVLLVSIFTLLIGAPSAVSLDFFNNQDWVWGLGLLLSGFFFTFAVIKIGAETFIREYLKPEYNPNWLPLLFKFLFYVLLPLEFVSMLVWWLWQSVQWYPDSWWNPLEVYSFGTTLLQWALILLAGLLFNRKFVKLLK
ncbi:MAG TPA: sodium-dependent transporter [Caldithrix abyssi]|uniref:Sodium-dependent transporter n=1 Tax=Caldithrix abyssi TaxID=187145 RepID=A0A7V4WUP9_CALAY|nr:sodium-dependent transporter [Caldithrix abyssi]